MGTAKQGAAKSFRFFECTGLIQPSGLRAQNLPELLSLIRTVSPGVIYHHTHQYFLKAAIEVPEYPGDFAVWAAQSLEERALAEKLAGVELVALSDLEEVRRALIEVIESYLRENPPPRPAREGDAFFFNDAVTIVAETGRSARTLPEFAEALGVVGASSIYFHFYEARLRLNRPTNDFSVWLAGEAGHPDLAKRVRALDPYQYSLEGLRRKILALVESSDSL